MVPFKFKIWASVSFLYSATGSWLLKSLESLGHWHVFHKATTQKPRGLMPPLWALHCGWSQRNLQNGGATGPPSLPASFSFPTKRPDPSRGSFGKPFFRWSLVVWPKLKSRLQSSSCLSLPGARAAHRRFGLRSLLSSGGPCLSSYWQPPRTSAWLNLKSSLQVPLQRQHLSFPPPSPRKSYFIQKPERTPTPIKIKKKNYPEDAFFFLLNSLLMFMIATLQSDTSK